MELLIRSRHARSFVCALLPLLGIEPGPPLDSGALCGKPPTLFGMPLVESDQVPVGEVWVLPEVPRYRGEKDADYQARVAVAAVRVTGIREDTAGAVDRIWQGRQELRSRRER